MAEKDTSKDINGSSEDPRNTAGKNITSDAATKISNGYIGGDRTRSSSSHQFHKESSERHPS